MDKTINFAVHNLQLYGPDYIAPNQTVSALIHFLFCGVIVLYLMFYHKKYQQRDRALVILLAAAFMLFLFSAVYHSLAPMSALREIFHRLDHVGIALLFSAVIYMLHKKYTHVAWQQHIFVATMIFLSAAIMVKLSYFDFFLGWKGLLFFLAIFSLGFVYIAKTIQLVGWRRSRYLSLGVAVILLAALLERIQFPVLAPGLFGPHEFLHVAAGVCVWLIAIFTVMDTNLVEVKIEVNAQKSVS